MFSKHLMRVAGLRLLFLCLLLPVASTAFPQSRHVDEVVQSAIDEDREIPVIVRFASDEALERGSQTLTREGGRVGSRHRALRAVDARASGRALRALLDDPGASSISYDATVFGLQTTATGTVPVSVDGSGASTARRRYGVDGSGVRVAVVDSGIQPQPDLPSSRIAAFVDFVNGRKKPYDDYGHGTHVAGIIAGSGIASNGQYTGVAPGADIVALKVLDASGAGSTSTVIAALEWVLDNAGKYNIRVVNISLGHPVFESVNTDPLVAIVEELTRHGIVVVASAGNLGVDKASGEPRYGTVTSPGNAASAITVGAVHTHGSLARSDDTVADFSSKGPTRFDLQAKPDIVAPGYAIVSLEVAGSYLQATYPQLEVAPGYFRLSGTSMAAPIAAGAAALMLQANPLLSAHTVKVALQFTAQHMTSVDALTQGAGEINVAGAVRLAELIEPTRGLNYYWLRVNAPPNPFDVLFGEHVEWVKRAIWGDRVVVGDSAYVHLRAWDDDIAWSQQIVWATAENIVWATANNIVWATNNNIVWATGGRMVLDHANNIVWATANNIVWATANNIVWATAGNIVWATADNIVWATGGHLVRGSADNIVWATDAAFGVDDYRNAAPPTIAAFDQRIGPAQIVWATAGNIVWATAGNIVWATADNIVWATSDSESVMVGEMK